VTIFYSASAESGNRCVAGALLSHLYHGLVLVGGYTGPYWPYAGEQVHATTDPASPEAAREEHP
jgi:hypothetical protein